MQNIFLSGHIYFTTTAPPFQVSRQNAYEKSKNECKIAVFVNGAGVNIKTRIFK